MRWRHSGIMYPCLRCHGSKTIYDPNDPRDPIEGNKLRSVIECPNCKGTGKSSQAVLREAWREERAEHKKRRDRYQQMCNMLSSIESQLTDDQIKFLKEHCGRCFTEKEF